ncbi:MAG: family 43 glycosylhydrolase [Bacteroidales bacterium]|nr:family 43 glycosylhydrolase [Bacteroidales bacterium]
MNIRNIIFLLTATLSMGVAAQNPIVPPGVYIADPEGHQWKDGKFYIYGSRDESTNYYCSWQYNVLSTPDLKNWTLGDKSFSSMGNDDRIPYSDALLFAPDCAYKDGNYYLYYCIPHEGIEEGVAVSSSPTGPFSTGQQIKGIRQIDPAVLVDDDGQAYLIWGQFSCKGAKLKPNMTEVDTTTIVDGLVTEKEHMFHEGASIRKRNGIYYLVYSQLRKDRPTCLGYATSTSPLGPYTYRGIIIDNAGCDPESWNNHGSIAEFNGKWYVLYHRSTHGSRMMRKACIEPITFNEDGTINEVEMTSQGAGDPLNPFEEIDAAKACGLWGNVRIELIGKGNEALTKIRHDNYAVYKYLYFNKPAKKFCAKVNSTKGGKIILRVGNNYGPVVGTVNIPKGNGKGFKTYTCDVESFTGIEPLFLTFVGTTPDTDLFALDSFYFE